jgi:CheY-like chemotaxis protein
VDDYEDSRLMYAEYLASKGYIVDTASNGAEAIEKVCSSPPDVIALDLSMPIVDGWSVAAVLKRDPRTKHIYIIAITGHGEGAVVQRAKDAGCDVVLLKPILPAALVETIESLTVSRARPAVATR